MSSSAEATDNEKVAATTSDDSMDAILKDALDEFDDDDDDVEEAESPSPRQKPQVETVSEDDENDGQSRGENETPPSTRFSGPLPSPANNHSSSFSAAMMDEDALLQSMLQDFMQTESAASENDPAAQLGAFLKQVEAAQQLASTSSSSPTAETSHKLTATKPNTSIASESTNNKAKPKASPNSSSSVDNNSTAKSAMEDTIHSLLQDMAKVNVDDDQEGEGGGPELSLPPHNTEDELFQQLFGNFGGTESSFEPDAMIDGMMEQLLSKELMYGPMKSVTDKFPEWLEEQKNLSKLSSEELKM